MALARHRHFARAAEDCGISQPALSARIRKFEEGLGAPLIRRGNRFMGFTAEGEIALRWARRLLQDVDGFRQDVEAAKGGLAGNVALGSVPTALAFVAQVPGRLRRDHPGLTIQIRSLSSSAIRRGLEDLSLDAGITYLDDTPPPGLSAKRLYQERYVLLAPPDMVDRSADQITWERAADLPLCLLTSDMRNRRIIDRTFEAAGVRPEPIMETNAFTAALVQVAGGTAATIAPERLADNLPIAAGAARLSLVEPTLHEPVGVLFLDRDPRPPALEALLVAAEDVLR